MCFVPEEVFKAKLRRPRKTPLFVAPPPPDGYKIEYARTLASGDITDWHRLWRFYDNWAHRGVKVKQLYARESSAERVAARVRKTSDYKLVRVVPHWETKFPPTPPPPVLGTFTGFKELITASSTMDFEKFTAQYAEMAAKALNSVMQESGWKDPGVIFNALPTTEVLTNCKHCGKSMYALKNGQVNYCSYECYASD